MAEVWLGSTCLPLPKPCSTFSTTHTKIVGLQKTVSTAANRNLRRALKQVRLHLGSRDPAPVQARPPPFRATHRNTVQEQETRRYQAELWFLSIPWSSLSVFQVTRTMAHPDYDTRCHKDPFLRPGQRSMGSFRHESWDLWETSLVS